MDKQRLTTLINQPAKLAEPDLQQLQQLKEEYPYFQALSPLLTIASKQFDPKKEKKLLQSAAIYSLDRKHLKDLLFDENNFKAKNEAIEKPDPVKKEITTEIPTKKEVIEPISEIKQHQAIEITKRDNSLSTGNLPDTFFQELFNDMAALKASKENYNRVIAGMASEKVSAVKKVVKNAPPTKVEKVKKEPPVAKKKEGKVKPKKKAEKKASNTTEIHENQDLIQELTNLKEKKIIDAHKKEQIEIINNFIEKEPIISKKISSDTVVPKKKIEDLSEASTNLSDDVVSETLAKLMIKQGRKIKAIEIYKKLIWKFPQKKTYFVEIIEALKKES